ncbi:MAG TPA: hypothetical protein VG253_04535 [Streptosporangiaceae bacterium]|nr:hypothetical protein [Streptosporangiaceae bacterium]
MAEAGARIEVAAGTDKIERALGPFAHSALRPASAPSAPRPASAPSAPGPASAL